MSFSSFTLLLTDECNYACSYCYQVRGNNQLSFTQIKKAFDFFLPYLSPNCYINFSGGEPLLAAERICEAVKYLENNGIFKKKQFRYSLTTNGSLIDSDIIKFLSDHAFHVSVSFDGTAQDSSRQKESFPNLHNRIKTILENPRIELETNSVFTTTSASHISESIQLITDLGVPDITISLANIPPWKNDDLEVLKKELSKLRKYLLDYHSKNGTIPIRNYRERTRNSIFVCTGGGDRMALSADGKLWGCSIFADYYKGKEQSKDYLRFCMGDLDSAVKNYLETYVRTSSEYADLKMTNFSTPLTLCSECEDLMQCHVCPVSAALASSALGVIPSWTCEIQKIWRHERESFWNFKGDAPT